MTDRLQQQDDCCIQVFIPSSLFLGLTVNYSLPMSPKAELLVADNGRLMNSGRLMYMMHGLGKVPLVQELLWCMFGEVPEVKLISSK